MTTPLAEIEMMERSVNVHRCDHIPAEQHVWALQIARTALTELQKQEADNDIFRAAANEEADRATQAEARVLSLQQENERLRGALQRIHGASFPDAARFLMEGRWDVICKELQMAARTALEPKP